MADEPSTPTDAPQPDDGLSVRERRALHAKSQARKDAPGRLLRKAIVPAIVILLLAGIAAGFYFTAKNQKECPGHFHTTFAIYIPGDDNLTPEKVDFASPRSSVGDAYYQLNRAPGQSIAAHMHQSGAEQGSSALGTSQLHFEAANVCTGLRDTLHDALEVDVSNTKITLFDAHAQVGQDGTWTANETHTLRFFVQGATGGAWDEKTFSDYRGRQMLDGESFLIAFGSYTDEQIAQMQASIPVPVSRAAA